MIVGVPNEIKDRENRVAVTPAGVGEFVGHGHQVIVEAGAGAGSGFADDEFVRDGAEIVPTPEQVFATADMIMKVKEPASAEYDLLRPGQLLFTYLHLAANAPLTEALMRRRVQAVAYETVRDRSGTLPLLTPMSEVAGRMSIQVGAHYLESTNGGGGRLLGGVPGVPAASVVIIGGGVVGANAAEMALGLGASVTIIDRSIDRLRFLDQVLDGRIHTLAANKQNVADSVREADLVIGAVLIIGAKAPKLVTAELVSSMRAGSVIVDVAIDQGGCIETAHPTSHSDPIYFVDGVLHYCVTNMPGAVPRTSTLALSNPALASGVNVLDGNVTFEAVAQAVGVEYTPLTEMLTPLAAAATA
jgi:alanine dehydrogenase